MKVKKDFAFILKSKFDGKTLLIKSFDKNTLRFIVDFDYYGCHPQYTPIRIYAKDEKEALKIGKRIDNFIDKVSKSRKDVDLINIPVVYKKYPLTIDKKDFKIFSDHYSADTKKIIMSVIFKWNKEDIK